MIGDSTRDTRPGDRGLKQNQGTRELGLPVRQDGEWTADAPRERTSSAAEPVASVARSEDTYQPNSF